MLQKTDQKVDLFFLGFKVPAGKVCVGGAGMALPGPCNAHSDSMISFFFQALPFSLFY